MEFRLPELGEGVYEAELSRWLIAPGAQIKPGQGLVEMLTDKATMEVPAPFTGVVTQLLAEPGTQVKVGQPILAYEAVGAAALPAEPPAGAPKEPAPAAAGRDAPVRPTNGAAGGVPVKAAPSVRLMARKLGVDITRVHGSGPQGRVLVEDLTAHVAPGAAPKPAAPKPDYGTPGTRVKFQGLRRRIAEHMVQAKQTIPHATYVDECDVTELVKLRDALKGPLAEQGVKLTYLAFVVRAVVGALKDVPVMNASLDEQAGEIVLHDQYHVGIAVAAPEGLIVPVIRDADKLDLAGTARAVERLSADARAGKAKRDDLLGGTFTVTSIGNIGGLFATPILNAPQVGILGIGKIVRRPVYDAHGQIRPADLMYLSLTFDHRVLDGAVAAAFGNAVIKRLQNPAALLVGA